MRRGSLLAAVLLVGVVPACSSEPDTAAPTTTTVSCPERVDLLDEAYLDEDPLQALDLYQPPSVGCDPVPLVVWVHGGGWVTGDKANGMPPKIDLWTAEGWAVASLNYRLTDRTAPDGERLLAPAHNQDVAAALGWLVDRADELGIDPTRIALLGHSAGAGIVAAVGADPTYLAPEGLEPADLACVAPLDTEGFDIATVVEGGGVAANLYRLVFGTDPARWDELSPRSRLGDAEVPDLFLVRRGEPGRRAQVDAFVAAARRADVSVTVVDLPTFTHADVNTRIGDATDDLLTPALQAFLADCLRGSGS